MRAFIAIELPQEIKDSLSKIQEQLKKAGGDVKWVLPKNIHLTLKFLGEIDNTKLNKINEIIEDVIKGKNSFQVRISSIGAFPKINFPRVIWIGIDKGDNETKTIANELEERIARVGIPREERPFSSHITIGRTKSTLNRERLVQNLQNLASNFGEENLVFTVKNITLFKSTLTPKGPIYEILKEASLKTT
jgi:2'-5' RNA ligase